MILNAANNIQRFEGLTMFDYIAISFEELHFQKVWGALVAHLTISSTNTAIRLWTAKLKVRQLTNIICFSNACQFF